MSNVSKKMLMGAAGAAGGDAVTVDQVFSTYLYTGTSSSQSHVNGIDLAGEGGLVWIKNRTGTDRHGLYDTARGATKEISSNLANAQRTATQTVTSFNNNGFSTGNDSTTGDNNKDYVSWSFRSAPKFFDIVQFSGGSTQPGTYSHGLKQTPGMILFKKTSGNQDWWVWHKDGGGIGYAGNLNTTGTFFNATTVVTAVSDTTFSVNYTVNANGDSYVAYLFADNSSEDAADQMISCGSYSASASGVEINLGWEPQWVMVKRTDSAYSWYIFDTMRSFNAKDNPATLKPNSSDAEGGLAKYRITSTGFKWNSDSGDSGTYIYMAIRAPMMAEPTDATKVFGISSDFATTYSNVGFPVDMVLGRKHQESNNWRNFARLIGDNFLVPNLSNAEQELLNEIKWDNNTGFYQETNGTPNIWHQWKRAKSYFDCVCYNGTGSARTIPHGLTVAPEMIWIKSRSNSSDWSVFHTATGKGKYLALNETQSAQDDTTRFNNTAPTDTHFSVGGMNAVNGSGRTYIAYLFSSLAGVSKVGSFTGTGSDRTIDCGFSNGARFVLIKRTSTTGPWLTFDSVRGINSGTDPLLRLNATNAQYSFDYIDPHSSGFSLPGDGGGTNTNGVSYIFYAIA